MMVHFLCVLMSHLQQPAVPVTAHPMWNAAGILFILHCVGSRFFCFCVFFFSPAVLVTLFFQYVFTSLFWCFTVWGLSILILFLCLLFWSSAAGRKKHLNANCVDLSVTGTSQLALHCRRQSSKREWGRAEHIFTVVIKAQWRDFLQLYVSWQLLSVPASASYGQTQ